MGAATGRRSGRGSIDEGDVVVIGADEMIWEVEKQLGMGLLAVKLFLEGDEMLLKNNQMDGGFDCF